MWYNRAISFLLLCLTSGAVYAAEGLPLPDADSLEALRPVEKSFTFEVGANSLADTYLSPLRYKGTSFAISYERQQAMRFDPRRWNMRLSARVSLADTQNPARNADIWNLNGHLDWSMRRIWSLPLGFSAGVGGGASLNLGCLYSTRNGNNPASAKAAFTVDLAGFGQWRGSLWRLPLTVRYQPSLPLLGCFFSPEYGQLYYEIYMGDNDNLAHFAHFGNYFALENLFTVDVRFGKTSVRLGYRGDILSTKVNNITSRDISHAFIIGITTRWISI